MTILLVHSPLSLSLYSKYYLLRTFLLYNHSPLLLPHTSYLQSVNHNYCIECLSLCSTCISPQWKIAHYHICLLMKDILHHIPDYNNYNPILVIHLMSPCLIKGIWFLISYQSCSLKILHNNFRNLLMILILTYNSVSGTSPVL